MQTDPQFEALLVYLKQARGFDFTGYKRASLVRRVNRRLSQLGVEGYQDYLDHLQVHPDEFATLFNTILINVTGFFRDPDAWDYLRAEVVDPMVKDRDPDAPIRVWSAGCASGEEAYTLAMVFAETLGAEDFRRRVKIYATDADEEGLSLARQATYLDRDIAGLPPELLDRYFEQVGQRYTFRKDLRRSVIFGRTDLVQDAPISRIDLLVCRNTLMYFTAETQSRILSRFHFALGEGGVLFLGKAEMLLSHTSLFQPIDLKQRVFRKINGAGPTTGPLFTDLPVLAPRDEPAGLDRLRNEAFAASPVAQLVITADGLVALSNRQADALFGVSARDIGRPFRDLDVSYRPVELRGHIERAQLERRPTRIRDVRYSHPTGGTLRLEVQVNPLVDDRSRLLGVNLVFDDVTAARRLQDELELANRQLEAAYEELQSTNEELETTNEELQSTVEELETTNEELQSTNEELETINEELQSANDELRNINDMLRDRTGELNDANAFLEAILASLGAGVAVLDADLRVQVWNGHAEDHWGLRRDETVGQNFLNLDIGLPTHQLRPAIRRVMADGSAAEELVVDAVNRRGREVRVRVACAALAPKDGPAKGVILILDLEA